MKFFKFIFIILFSLISIQLLAQSSSNIDGKVIFKKEKSGSINVHSAGWGFGYRTGSFKNGFKKRMLEFEFVTMKHPKEIKTINPIFERAKSYYFGKLNNVFIVRSGYGIQKVLSSKPYWGGVEFRFLYMGGLSLGFTKPVYLYIYDASNYNEVLLTVEKYDPNKHSLHDIYGKGPFGKGIDELKLYPGLYTRLGLNFEYGIWDESIKAIETGVIIDVYPKPIPIMAFNDESYFFLSFYLSFNFGKRFN
ncbi:MAG: hypothetical protein K9J13_04365 [Saprospiraceae bacterium]|nr:hypothetical protein [Saprospiraceae bacterium]